MKLANLYVARDAWQRLAALRMPPHTAYKVLKYIKQVIAESEVIEQTRVKLLRESTGIAEGDINLQPGSAEHLKFAMAFNTAMDCESDLKLFGMTLGGLLDLLGKEQGNMLSVQDLAQLEPFFEEPKE
jgi:hypothetical protein